MLIRTDWFVGGTKNSSVQTVFWIKETSFGADFMKKVKNPKQKQRLKC